MRKQQQAVLSLSRYVDARGRGVAKCGFFAAVVALGLASLMSFHSTKAVAQETQPVKIGLVQALSGPGSVLSPPVTQAAELAVDEVNAAGGILGRKVELVLADDGTDPRIAEQAWDTLVNRQKVDFIISLETSAGREAGLPIALKGNIPAIYTSLYEGQSCNPILYANDAVPSQQISPLISFLKKEKGAKTWFLVGSDYLWPRETFNDFKAAIEKAGGEVMGEEFAPIGTLDWAATINKIQRANPDVVLLAIAGGADNVSFMKQKNASGVGATVASFDIEESVLAALGEDGEGIFVPASYFSTLGTEANKKFVQALKSKFGENTITPTFFSAPTYDAVHQFAAAAAASGTIEAAPVLKALSTISFSGPRGAIAMTTDRHASLPIYIAKGRADGTFDIVEEYGNSEPSDQCDPDPAFGQ